MNDLIVCHPVIFNASLMRLLFAYMWQNIWIDLSIIIAFASATFIVFTRKVKAAVHEKALVEQEAEEVKELLAHARDNEQKVRNEISLVNRSKSLLLSRLSHEIRTPMNGVIGMASLLTETPLSDEQREYAETIRYCSNNLIAVINDMLIADVLEFSEDSAFELEHKTFELAAAIEEVMEVFAVKASEKGLELLYHLDDSIPEYVMGDVLRIKQVLMNLMENALSYTFEGEIFIGVHLLGTGEGNQLQIGFNVIDTGIGLLPSALKGLNEQSSEHLRPLSAQKDNEGLGLLICKRIIEMMGGTMEVRSSKKTGTVVKFSLKLRTAIQSMHTVNPYTASFNNKRLLVVVKNETLQRILKHKLQQWKLQHVVTGNGAEALEILESPAHFDAVLTEVNIPGMNGLELAQAIHSSYNNLPVLLLSSPGNETHNLYQSLFKGIINKPIHMKVLYKQLSNLLQSKQAPQPETQARQKLSSEFAKAYPMRILIAEDDKINQQIAIKVLSKLGYTPEVAVNGQEVLEMAGEKNYDLILMDVQMPLMDGLEATRMIRLCLSSQPVIIAMTANAMTGDQEKCIEAGMDDYISKPVNLDELIKTLEKWALHVKTKSQ